MKKKFRPLRGCYIIESCPWRSGSQNGTKTFETESKEQISAIQLDINGLQSFETKGEVDINEMKQGIAALETSNSEAKAQLDELDTKLMQTAVGLQASASGSGGAIAFNCYRTSE